MNSFETPKRQHPIYKTAQEAYASREKAIEELKKLEEERSSLSKEYHDRAAHLEAYRKKSMEMVYWEVELKSCDKQIHDFNNKQ